MTKARLTEIMAKHDPIALIKIGAPDDEYSSEAKALMEILEVSVPKTEGALVTIIHEIFVEQLSNRIAGPRESYEELGREIFAEVTG